MADQRSAAWNPIVERTTKAWFGPRKRARELLSVESRPSPLPAAGFLDTVWKLFGQPASNITGVRLIDFVHGDDGFRYTIALCSTLSDPVIREVLHHRASDVVAETGWYPLVTGERLASARWVRSRVPKSVGLEIDGPSSMVSVESAGSGAEAGTAIRVRFDTGSALLDVGFGPELVGDSDDVAVLLSHGHRDHAGAVLDGFIGGLPVIMSKITCLLLGSRVERIGHLTLVEPGLDFRIGAIQVQVVSVPHVPGSVAYLLDDGRRALLYTGDVVLRTARHSVEAELLDVLPQDRQCTVLLDATMAGRPAGASNHEVAGEVLSLGASDIVLVGAPDQLTYALADLFHIGKESPLRGTVSYLASGTVRSVVKAVHDAFIRRDHLSLDPLLRAQYGRSMSAWAESVWLYWLDHTQALPAGRRIWLIDPNASGDRFAAPPEARVLSIGRGADLVGQGIDTSPWTAHSSEEALIDFVRLLEERGVQVVLFHNFSRRLKKFARTHALAAKALQGSIPL
ncbi:hypothetical protein [Mycobacterium sp. GA-1285]|uniref:hypothetical protein n=1 Tax=Mycobacterium sp. GA-1285 TaxID=1772282 RepID=UPI000B2EE5AE|nr:hypothetical protein [Mycobacterium sp. GA-1285]